MSLLVFKDSTNFLLFQFSTPHLAWGSSLLKYFDSYSWTRMLKTFLIYPLQYWLDLVLYRTHFAILYNQRAGGAEWVWRTKSQDKEPNPRHQWNIQSTTILSSLLFLELNCYCKCVSEVSENLMVLFCFKVAIPKILFICIALSIWVRLWKFHNIFTETLYLMLKLGSSLYAEHEDTNINKVSKWSGAGESSS